MSVKEKNSVVVELYDLALTEKKDDRFGRVLTSKSLNEENLIAKAVKGRTDLSEDSMRSAINILKKIAIEEISNGASVHFGLGYFHLNVNGVFITDNEKWDSTKHSLTVHVTPTAQLRSAVKNCEVDVRGRAAAALAINSVQDFASNTTNMKLTPGGPVIVTGSRIKIEGDKEGVGIKLINEDTKAETVIASTHISINSPSTLNFVVPDTLVAGDYRIAITTQFSSSGTQLKEARTYTFEHILVVD